MKKWMILVVLALMLTGCTARETYETVADEVIQAVSAQPRQIHIELPEEAVLPVMENEDGQLYMCKDYDVEVMTLDGGDIEKTIRTVTGMDPEDLTIMETLDSELSRREFVWTAAGELGEQVCRGAVLDDGSYHYVLCAMIDAQKAAEYQEIWNGLFESFSIT